MSDEIEEIVVVVKFTPEQFRERWPEGPMPVNDQDLVETYHVFGPTREGERSYAIWYPPEAPRPVGGISLSERGWRLPDGRWIERSQYRAELSPCSQTAKDRALSGRGGISP